MIRSPSLPALLTVLGTAVCLPAHADGDGGLHRGLFIGLSNTTFAADFGNPSASFSSSLGATDRYERSDREGDGLRAHLGYAFDERWALELAVGGMGSTSSLTRVGDATLSRRNALDGAALTVGYALPFRETWDLTLGAGAAWVRSSASARLSAGSTLLAGETAAHRSSNLAPLLSLGVRHRASEHWQALIRLEALGPVGREKGANATGRDEMLGLNVTLAWSP